MIDLILVALGLIGLTIATITDIKTKEIPDWLSYSLIISGFTIRLLNSLIYQNFEPLAYVALAFVIVFLISNILYFTKQWGGGDAKMLMALSIIFAVRPSFLQETNFPFLLILITNILFIGAIYGIIYGVTLAIKKREQFKKEISFLTKQKTTKKIAKYTLVVSIIWIAFIIISKTLIQKIIFTFLAIFSPSYFLLWLGTKTIENISMYKKRAIKNLKPGDWLASNIIDEKGNSIIKKTPEGLTEKDIIKLKHHKIKTVTIKEGIPFIPPFLIGTILTLLTNKLLFFIP